MLHAYNSSLGRQRLGDCEFESHLINTVRPCLKPKKDKLETETNINEIQKNVTQFQTGAPEERIEMCMKKNPLTILILK